MRKLNHSFSPSHNSLNAKKLGNFIGSIVQVQVLVLVLVLVLETILLGSNSTAFSDFVFFDQTSNFSNMYLL